MKNKNTAVRRRGSLEDRYEQVEQQDVGEKQVNTEHDDGEPLREGWCLVFIQHGTLGLQRVGAIQGAGVYVKCSFCRGRRDYFLSCDIINSYTHKRRGIDHLICELQLQLFFSPSPLTVNISGEIPKYDEVWLVNGPADDPVQSIVVVDENALLGHTIRHDPDTQQEHEEEHIRHLKNKQTFDTSQKL